MIASTRRNTARWNSRPMSGADERVRPSKREAEQAVIISCVAGRIVRPRWCTARMCGAISHCWRAVASTPLPLPLGGLTRDAFDRQRPQSRVNGGAFWSKPHGGMIAALVADAVPLSASEIVAKLRAGAGESPRSLPRRGCSRGCSRSLDRASSGNPWPGGSNCLTPARRDRLATSREPRDGTSAHDERSYRLATVIA